MNPNHPHIPPPAADPDTGPSYRPRQQGLKLVAQIRAATGRRHGSATAAARTLGLDAATVQKWVRGATPPPAAPARDFPLTGLLHCAACHQPMRPTHTPDGQRAYHCGTGCRPTAINANHVEQAVGKALLCHTPSAVRHLTRPAATEQATTEDAATAAPALLRRVTVGRTTGQLKLTWHPHPTPNQRRT